MVFFSLLFLKNFFDFYFVDMDQIKEVFYWRIIIFTIFYYWIIFFLEDWGGLGIDRKTRIFETMVIFLKEMKERVICAYRT